METKTLKIQALIKGLVKKVFSHSETKVPNVKNFGMMTSIEVMALAHAELGLELYPFHLYKGVLKGNFTFKGEIPLMKKMSYVGHQLFYTFRDKITEIKNKFSQKGWISEKEIAFLESHGFSVGTEDIPAIFIVAPTVSRSEDKIIEISEPVLALDPIIFIKYSENEYLPVHSWDNSAMLNSKLAGLN